MLSPQTWMVLMSLYKGTSSARQWYLSLPSEQQGEVRAAALRVFGKVVEHLLDTELDALRESFAE